MKLSFALTAAVISTLATSSQLAFVVTLTDCRAKYCSPGQANCMHTLFEKEVRTKLNASVSMLKLKT